MGRVLLTILLALIISESIYGQFRRTTSRARDDSAPYLKFEIGTLDPEDTDSGRLFGTGIGFKIDDRLAWGLNLRYFRADFEKQDVIAEFDSAGINFEQVQVELRFKTTIFAAMLNLDYEVPFGRSPFVLRAAAGMGWELIWNEEDNFLEQVNRQRFFNGFGWQLSGGLGMQISESGILYVEGLYNDATATRNDRAVDGLPTFSRINVSGVGVIVGVKVINLLRF